MSYINFHSPKGTVEVRGTERGWFKHLENQMLLSILVLESDRLDYPHPLRKVFPPGHYSHDRIGKEWAESVAVAISVDPFLRLKVKDQEVDACSLASNTALSMGNDQIKLAVRLHSQCEVNAFVEGKNRAWLADIIESGLHRVFRDNVGWEKVIELLRSADDEPVVTSFSVSEYFPYESIALNEGVWTPPEIEASEEEDDEEDAWYALSESEQWRLAMEALRLQSERESLSEMKPENWDEFRFSHCLDAFDVMNEIS